MNNTLTTDDLLSIMNATVNAELISRCKKAIKQETGLKPFYDKYIHKWILVW